MRAQPCLPRSRGTQDKGLSEASWWGGGMKLRLLDPQACGRAMPREGWDSKWAPNVPPATPGGGALGHRPQGATMALSGGRDCRPRLMPHNLRPMKLTLHHHHQDGGLLVLTVQTCQTLPPSPRTGGIQEGPNSTAAKAQTQDCCVCTPALPLTSGTLLSLSSLGPQFLHLKNGARNLPSLTQSW